MTARSWSIRIDQRPHTTNDERRRHWSEHGPLTKQFREAAGFQALAARIPPLEVVRIDVVAIWPNLRHRPDPGGIYPSAKAAIDGLVDAGVLPDDTDDHVLSITFHRTRIVPGAAHALELTVTEIA